MYLLRLALIVGLLCACKGDPGEQGATGLRGEQGPQGPKGDRGDPGATVKIPHLVVDKTGEDLGVALPNGCVWDKQYDAQLCYGLPELTLISFTSTDCTGPTYTNQGPRNRTSYFVAGTTLYYVDELPAERTIYSNFDTVKNQCVHLTAAGPLRAFQTMGPHANYEASDTRYELR